MYRLHSYKKINTSGFASVFVVVVVVVGVLQVVPENISSECMHEILVVAAVQHGIYTRYK